MIIHLVSQAYRRRWRQPLHTAHGVWRWRQGLLVRLENDWGRVGYGEIAPLPWFGSETLTMAQDFCTHLGPTLTVEEIEGIPDCLPATQFALASALEQIQTITPVPRVSMASHCHLLPSGETAMEAWRPLWRKGIRTFKLKLGLERLAIEMALVQALVAALPAAGHLRLDANGGLSLTAARQWLTLCDRLQAIPDRCRIDYLEQPLPPTEAPRLWSLAQSFSTPVALDESVATYQHLEEFCRLGWPGPLIVKPAIAGFPQRLRQIWTQYLPPLIFSSVFETNIGRRALLTLATEYHHYSGQHQALGLGGEHNFEDNWDSLTPDQLWACL
ncbi:MAG: o-succinylbenzoate synthase [Nodosilinea sp.]